MKLDFRETMLNDIFYDFKDCFDTIEFVNNQNWVVPFQYSVVLRDEVIGDYEEISNFCANIMFLTKFGEMKCQKIILDYKNKKISIQNFDGSTKDIFQTEETLKTIYSQILDYFGK
jgi:hypothetical protein